jgi:hypothetical protein
MGLAETLTGYRDKFRDMMDSGERWMEGASNRAKRLKQAMETPDPQPSWEKPAPAGSPRAPQSEAPAAEREDINRQRQEMKRRRRGM